MSESARTAGQGNAAAISTGRRPAIGNSRAVASRQTGPHVDLDRVVQRHLVQAFLRPIGPPAFAAWEQFRARWDGQQALVFDSGCGVGDSTRRLAVRHGGALVVGIDQSADRLARQRPEPLPANALLLRADLVDFWRLAEADGVRLEHHYLLYPNPWPKVGHLKRRWHGHPVFPSLLALGGRIELRTNWGVYAEEFAQALRIAARLAAPGEGPDAGAAAPAPYSFLWCAELACDVALDDPLTPFERKYAASGQAIHRVVAKPAA